MVFMRMVGRSFTWPRLRARTEFEVARPMRQIRGVGEEPADLPAPPLGMRSDEGEKGGVGHRSHFELKGGHPHLGWVPGCAEQRPVEPGGHGDQRGPGGCGPPCARSGRYDSEQEDENGCGQGGVHARNPSRRVAFQRVSFRMALTWAVLKASPLLPQALNT